MRMIIAYAALVMLGGCAVAPPMGRSQSLDRETATECRAHCDELSMDLGAVVIIRGSAGCVCQPRGRPVADAGGASAASGGALIALEADEERARARNAEYEAQRHQSSSSSSSNHAHRSP